MFVELTQCLQSSFKTSLKLGNCVKTNIYEVFTSKILNFAISYSDKTLFDLIVFTDLYKEVIKKYITNTIILVQYLTNELHSKRLHRFFYCINSRIIIENFAVSKQLDCCNIRFFCFVFGTRQQMIALLLALILLFSIQFKKKMYTSNHQI